MSLKLYRLDCECPACGRRPSRRVTDAGLRGYRAMPPNEIIESVKCERFGGGLKCDNVFWIRARAWHNAVPAGEAAGVVLDIQPAVPMVELTARQREVCALACDGVKDARIAILLALSFVTVRKHLTKAAARMRMADPALPRTSPRKTVQAYFRRQVQAVPTLELFREEQKAA